MKHTKKNERHCALRSIVVVVVVIATVVVVGGGGGVVVGVLERLGVVVVDVETLMLMLMTIVGGASTATPARNEPLKTTTWCRDEQRMKQCQNRKRTVEQF